MPETQEEGQLSDGENLGESFCLQIIYVCNQSNEIIGNVMVIYSYTEEGQVPQQVRQLERSEITVGQQNLSLAGSSRQFYDSDAAILPNASVSSRRGKENADGEETE